MAHSRKTRSMLAIVIALWASATSELAGADASPHRFALLVGCTKYDNNKTFRLVGPGNDVELFRTVLIGKLGYQPENIVTLSEKIGGRFRPTYANIAREFAALAARAKAGDEVIVLLGGHGSQQPEQNPPDRHYPKPNGRDQIFLPADIGVWDGSKEHKVAGAIADYELRQWTKAITKTGASLWLIVDACCSGSTLRGNEVARKVAPEDLGIPAAAMAAAEERARRRGGQRAAAPELLFELDDQSPNFVAIYAARPDEPTVERPMPVEADDPAGLDGSFNAKTHGLLTYTLCDILERSDAKLSYLELHNLTCDRYQQMGRTSGPRPITEGLARERMIRSPAGARATHDSQLKLAPDPSGEWKVNGGRLQGLTPGSVLTVWPPRDQKRADKPLGHVRVKETTTLEAAVEPCEYAGQPPPKGDQLAAGLPCELVYRDYRSMRLNVAVDRAVRPMNRTSESANDDQLASLHAQLKALGDKPDALFTLVAPNARPDWVVQSRGGKLLFLSADAAAVQGELPPTAPRFALSPRQPLESLVSAISHVFRARNLLALTAPAGPIHPPDRDDEGFATDPSIVDVEVEIRLLAGPNDRIGKPLKAFGNETVIPAGQWIAWQVNNHCRYKVDVTLLFVDSELNIVSAFPRAGSGIDNTITPGGRILTDPARTTKTNFDFDRIVAIAVKSEGQPIDFSVLEQTTLEAGRGALRGAGDATLDSPLGRLCQAALYGAGGARGGIDLTTAPYAMSLISWRVK